MEWIRFINSFERVFDIMINGNLLSGIHHITAIAGDPQKNVDFFVKILGLRFLKKTINFDDPHTYHFYYGDENGNPGTILTFFPWTDRGFKGKRGTGQIAAISFSVPLSSLDFWVEHLTKQKINFAGPIKRFDEQVLIFEDHDEFELEIVATEEEKRPGWDSGFIPKEHSIRGFWGASIWHQKIETTETFMSDLLGFKKVNETENRVRLALANSGAGTYVDLISLPEQQKGIMGVGAIHHIAFRTKDEKTQLEMRKKIINKNFDVTPAVDRNYFHSIYFKEPGNVLFEIATDPPGFFVDETKDELGKSLKLPEWYESIRAEIESALPKITIPE
jgi:glyoxalase family protein